MIVVDKLKMLTVTVSDIKKAKTFYVDTLGMKITQDYREDDDNWWVRMEFPGGGADITVGRAANYGASEALKPGMVVLYFETLDVTATHEELSKKGLKVGEIHDDLFGPGSNARFFSIEDPDGNSINIFQS